MGSTDNTASETARSILSHQAFGQDDQTSDRQAITSLRQPNAKNISRELSQLPRTRELERPAGLPQKPTFDIADQGFTLRTQPYRITRIQEPPRKPSPQPRKVAPVMPVDEANSADNAKLLERQNAKARKQAKRDAVILRDREEKEARLQRLETRRAARLQQQKAEQKARQQRQAVNAVKKITKAVYARMNPAVVPPLPEGEGRGEGPLALPQLSDEVFQSNQRLAESLKKRAGVGDLPRFTTDAINSDGVKAISEVADLIDQVRDHDPAQAQELFDKTMQGITPENQDALMDTYEIVRPDGKDENTSQPSLEKHVEDIFGMEADVERPQGMLPMPDKIDPDGKGLDNIDWSNWTAPEWAHEGAKAVALPGHAMRGGKWSEVDVSKAALSVNAGSALSSAPAGALRSGVTRLRGTPKFMRKVDLEKQGQDAARKAMDDKTSVPQAMFREDVGEITFDYGSPRLGLEHIRSGRMQKDGMSEDEAMAFIQKKVPEVLAHGTLKKLKDHQGGRRVEISHKGNKVVLALDRRGDHETWIITGFEEW